MVWTGDLTDVMDMCSDGRHMFLVWGGGRRVSVLSAVGLLRGVQCLVKEGLVEQAVKVRGKGWNSEG